MKCPQCGGEISINRQFCNFCGSKVEVAFGTISESVSADARSRETFALEETLRSAIILLVFGFVGVWMFRQWTAYVPQGDFGLALQLPVAPPVVRHYEDADEIELAMRPHPPRAAQAVGTVPVEETSALFRTAYGDSEFLDVAARKALRYLCERQRPDGGWASASLPGKPFDEGAAGLAVAALASAGQDSEKAEYSGNYKRAVEFLLKRQESSGGFPLRRENLGFGLRGLAAAGAASPDEATRKMVRERIVLGLEAAGRARSGHVIHTMPGYWEAGTEAVNFIVLDSLGYPTPPDSFNDYDLSRKPPPDTFTPPVGAARKATVEAYKLFYRQHLAYLAISTFRRAPSASVGRSVELLTDNLPHLKPVAMMPAGKYEICDPLAFYVLSESLFQYGGTPWKLWEKHLRTEVVESQREDGSWGSIDPDTGDDFLLTAVLANCLQVFRSH